MGACDGAGNGGSGNGNCQNVAKDPPSYSIAIVVVIPVVLGYLAALIVVAYLTRNRWGRYVGFNPQTVQQTPSSEMTSRPKISAERAIKELNEVAPCQDWSEYLHRQEVLTNNVPGGEGSKKTFRLNDLATVECAICLLDIDHESTIRELCCAHVFHDNCLQSWYMQGQKTCPLCRIGFVEKGRSESS